MSLTGEKPISQEVLTMQKMNAGNERIYTLFQKAKKLVGRYGRIGLVEPEDLVQEVMLKVLSKVDGKQPSSAWLFKVVRSCAADAGRHARGDERFIWRDRFEDSMVVCERAEENGYKSMYRDCAVQENDIEIDLLPRLKNMLAGLSKPARQVLILYSEGFSYLEIAELTGSNVGTVRSRLHYARRRAKELLADV